MTSLGVLLAFAFGGIALPTLLSQQALAAGTQVVNADTSAGENQPGWMFNRDGSTSTPYEFNFDQASIGNGSLYVPPIGAPAANKFIAENFLLTPMANVNGFSYDFRIGSGGDASDAQQFYMNVYANFGSSASTKFYDCRYNVVPTVGSTGAFTTVTFDPNQSYPVTTHGTSPETCPSVPAMMDTMVSGSTIRAFAISVGDTAAGDIGLDGYLDNVVVDLDSDVTTYDFDPAVPACTAADNGNFEGFTAGSVNGQGGWSSTGPYDQEVVHNGYGYAANGCKSLRLSNAVTSGSFGDQTFSYSTANEAGETSAENGGLSGGTRQTRFEAQWDFASTTPTAEQPGLAITASPDRGDGARMGWVQMVDTPTGLAVNVFDYESGAPDTGSGEGFVYYPNVASGLDRSVPHQLKVIMDLVDGPQNDVVRIYVDDVLVHTGTSWEDYFREQEGNPTRTVDSILFRASGSAVPANAGNGFLFDNVGITTSTPDTTGPTTPVANPGTGVYTSPQFVSLTSSDSDSGLAAIYYTTDGSTPNNTGNGTLYTTPIPVSQDLVLKAIAYDNAGNASSVMTEFYAVDIPSGGGSGSSGGNQAAGGNGGTNTVTSPGGFGATGLFGNFGAATGEVLGITTDNQNDQDNKNGKVKSESTSKSNTQDQEEDDAFLGLGWWWIPILVALLAIGYFVWQRFFQPGEEA